MMLLLLSFFLLLNNPKKAINQSFILLLLLLLISINPNAIKNTGPKMLWPAVNAPMHERPPNTNSTHPIVFIPVPPFFRLC